MYKAVIFDLDGVLCHTDHYHFLAWKNIANELNIHFDQEINQRLRGVSRAESFNIILENYDGTLNDDEKAHYIQKKNNIYVKLLNQLSVDDLAPGVLYTLQQLRLKGVKLAIGSSSKNAKLILHALNITHFFDAISDGEGLTFSKPHPEVFLRASEGLNLPASSCLVVEDAKAGIEAAFAANMHCAAIGEITNEQLATYNLQQLSDLLDIL